MAGSRRSPVLRDQWSTVGDASDQRDREQHRPRGPHRDRGRDRFRDKDRHHRQKHDRPDPALRSPPPRAFTHDHDDRRPPRPFSPTIASSRGSPGPPRSDFKNSHQSDMPPSSDMGRPFDRDHRRDDSPSAPPPFKRKRTRSPSPRGYHPRHSNQHPPRRPPFKPGDDFDRGPPPKRGRGRFPTRGRSGRRSPRRGRDRRNNDPGRRTSSRPRRSRSPVRGRTAYNPRRRFHSPHPDDDIEGEPRYRSLSRHSGQSIGSRYSSRSRRSGTMDTPRPFQSGADDSYRSPSPPSRRMSSISAEGDPLREAFPLRGSRPSNDRGARRPWSRPHNDKRQYSASPQRTPSNSYPGSPPPASPYSSGRGGWSGQQGNTSPYRHSGSYHQNQDDYDEPSKYPTGPSYRGGRSGYRGNYGGGRRFSGSGSQNYSNGPSPRGRGHFGSSQRSGPDSWGRTPHSPPGNHHESSRSPPPPPQPEDQAPMAPEDSNPADVGSQHQAQGPHPGLENGDPQNASQPGPASSTSATPNKSGKISFAFKAKTAPTPAPKPVPDLAQRMLAREPPPRAAEPPPPPRNRMPLGPPPKFKPDSRFDRRDRDRRRDRERDRGRNDRRGDFRDSRGGFREPRDGRDHNGRDNIGRDNIGRDNIGRDNDGRDNNARDNRRDDRRFEQRNDKRRQDRPDRRHDFQPDRRREPTPPEPKKQSKILTRPKARPVLAEEFAKSDSVYYRKPGNESVIGAGTYGKVFKAIHVYTQNKVALKKIRMEGEKDGFPVTAVREIKLLQHLRNHNVVSLLEVMVERNECFMVFEYLSHDLTGLINHPTFTLTEAHKKDLAKQMFEGLNYLHHRGVLHRDIKAANILISNRGQLKYADFGLARFFSKSRQLDYTNRVITIWYRPPELLLGETRYGPAVDVWSAACVYVEMFTKKAVFPGEGGEISQLDKLYNSLGTPTRSDWPDLVEMPWFELMRPTERKKRIFEEVYRDILSPAALDLVSSIFRYDPEKRPSAEEILVHPYFAEEEPKPQQAIELENIEGDWHEFESKALRKERDREARRAEHQKDKEKRKAGSSVPQSDREVKRVRPDGLDDSHASAPPPPQ